MVGSRRKRRLQAALVYAALIALAAVFLFPLLWVLGLSLKTRLQVFANPPLFIWWPTLENYVDVLGRVGFPDGIHQHLIVSASAVHALAVRRRAGCLRLRALSVHRPVASCSLRCW